MWGMGNYIRHYCLTIVRDPPFPFFDVGCLVLRNIFIVVIMESIYGGSCTSSEINYFNNSSTAMNELSHSRKCKQSRSRHVK